MPSFAGLISGVLGGTAKAYGESAQVEMKKQSELDLRKQLLEAESDKRLREDETKRARDVSDRVTEEARVQSPEYLAKAAATDLAKATGAIANRTTLAPLAAGADTAEYTAKKPLEEVKASDAVTAKIKETTSLAGNKEFLAGTAELSKATKAADLRAAEIRAESIRERASGGGGSGAVKVRSVYTNNEGQKVAVMSDGSEKPLGKAADYDKSVASLVTKMAKDDPFKFGKLSEPDKRKQAEERLRGQISVPSTGRDLSKLSAYDRDAKAD